MGKTIQDGAGELDSYLKAHCQVHLKKIHLKIYLVLLKKRRLQKKKSIVFIPFYVLIPPAGNSPPVSLVRKSSAVSTACYGLGTGYQGATFRESLEATLVYVLMSTHRSEHLHSHLNCFHRNCFNTVLASQTLRRRDGTHGVQVAAFEAFKN